MTQNKPTVFLVLLFVCLSGLVSGRGILQRGRECEIEDDSACQANEVCVLSSARQGTCARPPIGGAVISTDAQRFPLPLAYFPLSGDEIESWPNGEFGGEIDGAVLTEDADFGSVYRCDKDFNDSISIDNIPFGSDGQFALNLWLKTDAQHPVDEVDDRLQYVFSTARTVSGRTRFDESARNQVHVMLFGRDHPKAGSLRAIVNDRNDVSDRVLETHSEYRDVQDGQWHMVTLSTIHPTERISVANGFHLFIDGDLAAGTSGSLTHGGDPLIIDDVIHLCQRADGMQGTHFDGTITQLSIFDKSLTSEQVQEIYTATVETVFAKQPMTRKKRQSRDLIQFENTEMALRYVRGREVDAGLTGRPEKQQLTTEDMMNGFDYADLRDSAALCQTGSPDCGNNEICAVLHSSLLSFMAAENSEVDGICTKLSNGGSIWNASSTDAPIPLTYFPLTSKKIQSWPIRNKRGYRVKTKIVNDDVFGKVLSCKKEDRSVVVLENVQYGVGGAFGINFWFKAGDLSGRFLQYLFSHGSVIPSNNPWVHNQVQVLLPESDHVAHGVLRAIVKDTDDESRSMEGAIFLDSDGDVAKSFTKDPSTTANQIVDPTDGAWHMVTLTSHRNKDGGFLMYLDGMFVAEIDPDQTYTGDSDVQRSIPGGQPLRMGGKIYLCGRYDGSLHRHFDGRIAELSLFDIQLEDSDILQLYQQALEAHPDL